MLIAAIAMVAIAASPNQASGQDYASPPPSEPVPTLPVSRFVMPDVQDHCMEWNTYNGRSFSSRLTLVPIVDYTAFWQDEASVKQVGEQKPLV